ncbi:MAG: GNAT family N-acetyltransferase [Acidimicrobiia bacterium]
MIEIVPVTRKHADALLMGDEEFTARYGWKVVAGYLDSPEVLPAIRDALAEGADPTWGSHLVVDPEAGELVGFGGFKGPPEDGRVEIGYSVAPARRRKGHARDAAMLMIEQATQAGVHTVVAHTLAEPNVSNHLLENLDFTFVGEIAVTGAGPVWRWELSR